MTYLTLLSYFSMDGTDGLQSISWSMWQHGYALQHHAQLIAIFYVKASFLNKNATQVTLLDSLYHQIVQNGEMSRKLCKHKTSNGWPQPNDSVCCTQSKCTHSSHMFSKQGIHNIGCLINTTNSFVFPPFPLSMQHTKLSDTTHINTNTITCLTLNGFHTRWHLRTRRILV